MLSTMGGRTRRFGRCVGGCSRRPGKGVCLAWQVVLKIGADMLDVFTQIRERCARIALNVMEGGAVPTTS
jgi:hypothetical protein